MAKRKLKNRLIAVVLMAVLLFGIFSTVLIFFYSQKKITENLKVNLVELIEEQTHEIKQIFLFSSALVEVAAQRNDFVNYLQEDEPELQRLDILNNLNSYNIGDRYSAIYLMDKNGKTLASTAESFVGNNYGFRDYFIRAIDDSPWIDIALGVTSGELGYYFSHPIKNDQGKNIGVLTFKMRPDIVDKSLNKHSLAGDKDDVLMVDKDGIIIFSKYEERMYKSLGFLTTDVLKEIKEKNRYPNKEILPLQYDNAQAEIGKEVVLKSFDFFDQEDDKNEVLVMAKVDEYPFYILIEQNKEAYTAQAASIAFILSALVALAIFIIAAVLSFAISRLLAPLTNLKEVIEKVAAGDLNHRTNINTGDELEDLGLSFDKMTEKLQKSKESVEKEVQERTQDLQKLNRAMTGREIKMLELKKEIERNKKKDKKKKTKKT